MEHGFEVIRANASSVATKVVEFFARRDWSDEHLINEAVGAMTLPIEPEYAIAIWPERASPPPALIGDLYLVLDPIGQHRVIISNPTLTECQ
jgi:hypothetical protein